MTRCYGEEFPFSSKRRNAPAGRGEWGSDFHHTRVKENVYPPDWTSPQRNEYTKQLVTPRKTEPAPAVLGLNFRGNHTVHPGPVCQILDSIALGTDKMPAPYQDGSTILAPPSLSRPG